MLGLPRLQRGALVGVALVGLFVLGCRPYSRDLHVCGEGTHRETRVRFSVDERWCARNSQERHGLYTAWHVTGGEGKRLEGRFQDDLRSGTWQRWDDSGVLRWQGDYVDGARDGLWSYWHPNGERWKRGSFRQGVRVGLWTFWDRHGEVSAQVDDPTTGAAVGDASSRPAAVTGALRSLAGIRWSFPLDCGSSLQPIVVGDLAIAACSDKSLTGDPRPARIYAIDLQTGREAWRHDLSPVRVSLPWSDGESVYLAAGRELLALDAKTGEPWLRFGMEGVANAFSTAVRRGGDLYFSDQHGIYALDLSSRSLRWRYATESSANAPLVLYNDVLLARFWDTPGLHAIEVSTGRRRWSFAPEGSSRGSVAAGEHTVYFGSRDRRLHAVDLETGDEQWTFETGSWIHASPALSGDLVLAASGDGRLYAIERATGRERWRFATRSMIEHAVRSVGDVVLLRSRDGRFYALDRTTGNELWRFDTRTPWGSPPALGPGVVVFASGDGFLTALE